MMKLVASLLALLVSVEAFSAGLLNSARSSALNGHVLDNLEPHFDVVGQQGGGNLVENHGWANVQGGSQVDWSVAPSTPEGENSEPAMILPQMNDVVGEQGLVMTTKKNGMIVQGGADVDWHDKQFMNGN